MRRIAQAVLIAAMVCSAPFAAPSASAFEVQSGGVALSAQGVAMLANRLAARSDPLAAKAADPAGSGMSSHPAAGATRDQRIMEFMLGSRAKTDAKPDGRAIGLDELKAALKGRR